MELLLKRVALKETYTIGKLYVNGIYFSDTLEDRVRDLNKDGDLEDVGEGKVYGETAIPYGRYQVVISYSPKFKKMLPRLLNVKHFTGILIHAGNTAKDSHGCILVGKNTEIGKVTQSQLHMEKLMKLLERQMEIYITIQ